VRSLRSRLVVGCALIAILPLAIAMGIFSARMQNTAHRQAGDRLTRALAVVEHQLGSESGRLAANLSRAARDRELKEMFLLSGARASNSAAGAELDPWLEDQRAMMGSDLLQVTSVDGEPRADAALSPAALREGARARLGALTPEPGPRLAFTNGVPGLALVSEAPIVYQGAAVGYLRGGVLLDDQLLERLQGTSGVELMIDDGSGRIAATRGVEPAWVSAAHEPAGELLRRGSTLFRSFVLDVRGPRVLVTGIVSTAELDREVGALKATAWGLGLLGAVLAVLLGILWSSQVSRPVVRLAQFSERLARGEWDEPLALRSVHEIETLGEALERMRKDLVAYRQRLAVSERHAAWSAVARTVAHEIRNPLTPIAVSVADLRRSYEARRPDFPEILEQAARTIAEEVEGLKRMLNEFAQLGRLPEPEFHPLPVSDVLADVAALYGGDIRAGRLAVETPAEAVTLTADRTLLHQALVNLVQNGLEAVEGRGRVEVRARRGADSCEIEVRDDGPGLSPADRERIFEPRFTTKPRGSGLGLAIVERIVADHGGSIAVESEPGRGATFRVRLPLAA
jgi:signal transduction histidine kinase